MTDRGDISWPTAVSLLVAVVCLATGCQFDETQIQHDCPIGADVGSEAVCRDGRWVVPSDAADAGEAGRDTRYMRADAEVVGQACTEDEDCGAGVCFEGVCRACRAGQTRTSSESCGYEDRGTHGKVCENGRWVDDCIDVWYRSCREYLKAHPNAKDGQYELDPDGPDGEVSPDQYYCVMESPWPGAEVGWTRVAFDQFEDGPDGWKPDVGRWSCGHWGWIFGGHGNLGDDNIHKTFELPPFPGNTVQFYIEFIKIDSWDEGTDYAVVTVDGERIWWRDLRTRTGKQLCGKGQPWRERRFKIVQNFDAPGSEERSYKVEVTGDTNEPPYNESWGIDNAAFLIR